MYLLIPRRAAAKRSEGGKEVRGDDDGEEDGNGKRAQFHPFTVPRSGEERVACLPAESETKFRPECLSRSPILMASNRFEPNGMANV